MALPHGQDRAALGFLSGVLASAVVVLTSAADGRTVTAGIFAGVALFLVLSELFRLRSGLDRELPTPGRNLTQAERDEYAASLPLGLYVYTLGLGIACLAGAGIAGSAVLRGATGFNAVIYSVLAVACAFIGSVFVHGVIIATRARNRARQR